MSIRRRWIVRIALGLVVLFVAVVVAAVLLFDTIIRQVMIARVEAATGMKATIGAVHVGFRSGVVVIRDFRLYNQPEFGNSVCLDMPVLRIECDPAALTDKTLHLKLVEVDLKQIGVVEDKQGRSNFGSLEHKAGAPSVSHDISASGMKFAGIDTLDLSLGTLQLRDAKGRETDVPFNIHHEVLHNVKSESDLAVLGLIVALRGGHADKSGINLRQLLQSLQ